MSFVGREDVVLNYVVDLISDLKTIIRLFPNHVLVTVNNFLNLSLMHQPRRFYSDPTLNYNERFHVKYVLTAKWCTRGPVVENLDSLLIKS